MVLDILKLCTHVVEKQELYVSIQLQITTITVAEQ